VRFQYQVLAGAPGTNPGVPGYGNTDYWFVSHARGDLDGDGTEMWVEGYAASAHMFMSLGNPSGGVMLSGGWE
jgi:hypothetical protein